MPKVKRKEELNSSTEDFNDMDDQQLESMDDVYESLVDEFDQIRKCKGMYIAYEDTQAAMHLLTEIFQNTLDEFMSRKIEFHKIRIEIDEATQTYTVSDGGRGIPFAKLKEVCMKKHVSTKYERNETMKHFSGRNGRQTTYAVLKLL